MDSLGASSLVLMQALNVSNAQVHVILEIVPLMFMYNPLA
jgi:hypothetical protein